MIDISQIDYAALDRPEVLLMLFHPRPDFTPPASSQKVFDLLIPVSETISLGARFHVADKAGPNIIFFHGNGEIVSDYDYLGPLYIKNGLNFLPVDYRGYGRSGGRPSITSMMRDCHLVFGYVKTWLKENDYSGPLIVMGRSLGSASALELAANYPDEIDGLIVESGFAYAAPLLALLGVNMAALGVKEEDGFANIDKIKKYHGPTLIIHAEYDQIIPFSDGRALFEAGSAPDKMLLMIPMANHNDIFLRGIDQYLAAVVELARRIPRRG
ncbi:MAG: alpha/beta hydrolase [Deltaproteobacteria bacterium]|nr:alpha/beta hydrolase [Deltaproteobacteria bacterium]